MVLHNLECVKEIKVTDVFLWWCVRRENFQRLQQDLAEMIVSSLEKRDDGKEAFIKRKTLSTKVRWRDTDGSIRRESAPEYFHLAVTENPSTYLWCQHRTQSWGWTLSVGSAGQGFFWVGSVHNHTLKTVGLFQLPKCWVMKWLTHFELFLWEFGYFYGIWVVFVQLMHWVKLFLKFINPTYIGWPSTWVVSTSNIKHCCNYNIWSCSIIVRFYIVGIWL